MNDALTQRTLQLIAKHEALLAANLALETECANLQHRLLLASQRIDAVIARLPASATTVTDPAELDL
jgi:hypothetical protein